MFLSGDQIKADLERLVPDNRSEECVAQVSYDLRVGDEVYLSEEKTPKVLSDGNRYVLLPPGQFALIKTHEKVFVPSDYVGFLSVRSKLKLQGLINVSGFHVDPTYKGHLIFAVQNVGPNDIRLRFEDPAFMMMWAKLDQPYSGPARNAGHCFITVEQMAQLGGSSITLSAIQKQVHSLATTLRIVEALSAAAFLALLALLFERLTK